MHEGRGIQDTMTLSVLHISDLHRDPANPIGNKILLESLERDRDHYTTKEDPQIAPPNFIIVSGDIVQGVKHGTPDAENVLRQQYDEALTFLNDLSSRFVDGDNGRVIIVPGNHDVSDNKFRQSLTTIDIASAKKRALVTQLFTRDSPLRWSWDEFALYKIVDWETYHQRIAAFANFYKSFYDGQRSYSTDPSKQIDVFDFPDLGITVVGFCSCHNNDLLNRQAAVHSDCIAEAGNRLRDICLFHEPLRIAVWHHSTEGPPVGRSGSAVEMTMRPMFAVYVMWHPSYREGREIADRLRRHFVRDLYRTVEEEQGVSVLERSTSVPGALTPLPIDWNDVEFTAVVVLADSAMLNDRAWREHVPRRLTAVRLVPGRQEDTPQGIVKLADCGLFWAFLHEANSPLTKSALDASGLV